MQLKFRSKFVILHAFLFKTNHFQHQILIGSLLAAAIVQLVAAQPAAHAQTTPPTSPAQLIWQGPTKMASADRSQCASWRLNDDNQATAQSCDGASQTQPLGVTDRQVWAMFRQRFAPFRYATNVETVEFEGAGENNASAAWQRALVAWARGKYAEATLTATATSFPTVTATKVATFTPSPTGTATTTATATPFPTVTATKAASPMPTVTATATRTPTMPITPQPTASPIMTGTTVVSATVRIAPLSTPSATLAVTAPVTVPVTSTVQAIEALTNVNIRNGPGVTYPVVGRVTARQIVSIIGSAPENGWWRVICPTDATGNCFISANPQFTRPNRLAPTTALPAAALPAMPAAITPSGWLTYTDAAAKFTIAYPPTWTVAPRTDAPGLTGGVLSFQSSSTGLEPIYKIEIGQYQKPITNTADLAQWTFAYNQETSEFPAEQLKISVLEARTVDGLEAIFIRWSTPLGDSQYTNIRQGETVWFVWSNIGNLTDEETKTIYDQMVSSLNFE